MCLKLFQSKKLKKEPVKLQYDYRLLECSRLIYNIWQRPFSIVSLPFLLASCGLWRPACLAVGLHLDQLLCNPPVPPHHQHCLPDPASWNPNEWAWLECFSTTIKAAEALTNGAQFPESFTVPDLEPVPEDELVLLMVSVV